MKRASWAPPLTRTELLRRALLLAATAGFCALIFAPATHGWAAAGGLGLVTAALAGAFLTALEYLP